MNAGDALLMIRRAGGDLRLEGDRLIYRGPDGVLTTELLAAIDAERTALRRWLTWTRDPRPDLADDTHTWSCLLERAYEHDGHDPDGLFGVLHGLRCVGAALAWRDGWRLEPGEMSADEYAAHRVGYLLAHAAALRALLASVPGVGAGTAA